MSDQKQDEPKNKIPYEGDAILIEGRVKNIEREQENQRARDEKYKDDQLLINKLLAGFTGGLLVTGILTVLVYFDLAITSKRSAEAAQESAAAANNAARISGNTLLLSRDQFRASLRPYVSVTKMLLLGELKEGRKIKGRAEIVNSGRIPAVDLSGCADFALLPNGSPMTDDFPCPAANNPKRLPGAEISKFTLGSGAPFPLDSPGTSISPVNKLLPLLPSGALRIYFYGDLTYTDILNPKVTHHTTFCGRYNIATNSLD